MDEIFCSVIIPTIGRATLAAAVTSVLEQASAPAVQVVVVNDSGKPLPAAAWQTDPRVCLLETNRIERSRARNTGAENAAGGWFVFLDDDDWLLPDALAAFYRAAQNAQWLMGDCQLVTPGGKILQTIHFPEEGNCAVQAIAGEWMPPLAMCIARDLFFSVQGFHAITLGEDRDLASRLALHADLKRIPIPVACVVGDLRTSTSVYTAAQTEQYWLARDTLLAAPQTFARLAHSARAPYWRGRLARLYLNAAVLNGKRGRWQAAAARLGHALGALLNYDAVRHAPAFWRGVLRPHTSHTQ